MDTPQFLVSALQIALQYLPPKGLRTRSSTLKHVTRTSLDFRSSGFIRGPDFAQHRDYTIRVYRR